MARKILSTLLSVLMVAVLFAPISTVFAESETLLVVAASDNGGTLATGHARAAIANLKQSGDLWYSATRANCTPSGTAIATYRFASAADVEGVRIAFYSANNRTQTFSIEYSEDGENWDVALDETESALQTDYELGTAPAYTNGTHPAETFEFDAPVYASYLRVIITAATNQPAGTSNGYAAFHTFEAFGEYDPDAAVEPADYSVLDLPLNVIRDLTEDIYTEASWSNITSLIDSIDYNKTVLQQGDVNAYAAELRSAVEGLVINDADELQIAQSYYSTLSGSPAWTNGSMIFTEPEYSLTSYKMASNASQAQNNQGMTIASWLRIFCAPTDDAVIDPETGMYDKYEIVNIKGTLDGTSVDVTDDETVPQNANLADDDWGGYGFVLAINVNQHSYFESNKSQYASQEFANRNQQAYDSLALAVGDLVALHGVYNPYFIDGEPVGDIGAVDLDVQGTWVHRYGEFNGMGAPVQTPIYRTSADANPNAVEGGPQYLARDQFEDFISSATLTRYVAPTPSVMIGDVDGNGEITIGDVTTLAKAIAGWTLDNYVAAAADCDGNGEVTIGDVTTLAKYIAGWPITLG